MEGSSCVTLTSDMPGSLLPACLPAGPHHRVLCVMMHADLVAGSTRPVARAWRAIGWRNRACGLLMSSCQRTVEVSLASSQVDLSLIRPC